MYHQINIHKLSHNQLSKLLNGHRIRVKHGHGHTIHASAEQHKKIMKAHQKGCGVTVQFDPYQIQHHQHLRGHGIASDAYNTIAPIASSAFKTVSPYAKKAIQAVAPEIINEMAQYANKKVSGMGRGRPRGRRGKGMHYGQALNPAGYGHPHHAHHAHKMHYGHGDGFLDDAFKAVAPIAIDVGADYLRKRAGSGVGKRRGRKGKGPLGSLLGGLAGNFLPF